MIHAQGREVNFLVAAPVFSPIIRHAGGKCLGIVVFGAWREGIRVVGIALIVTAGIRLAIPEAHAGMLAVRPKPIDAAMLTGAGAVLLFLAGSIPDQPGL